MSASTDEASSPPIIDRNSLLRVLDAVSYKHQAHVCGLRFGFSRVGRVFLGSHESSVGSRLLSVVRELLSAV